MENKTDKPYSLQDAKESISKINGFNDWSYLRSKYSKDGIETTMAEAAELYASKATEELTERLKAAKAMMETYYSRSEELRKENEELQTQVSMFQTDRSERIEEMKRLKESNKQMKEIFNMIKPQLVKHGFKGTTEEIEKFIQKSEGDLLKVIIDKSKELDAEQKSHTVTNTDQLRINAIGKSEGDVNKKP